MKVAFAGAVEAAEFGGAFTGFFITLIFLIQSYNRQVSTKPKLFITGNVLFADGNSVENASVFVQGVKGTYKTDSSGWFQIKVDEQESWTVRASFEGRAAKETVRRRNVQKSISLVIPDDSPPKETDDIERPIAISEPTGDGTDPSLRLGVDTWISPETEPKPQTPTRRPTRRAPPKKPIRGPLLEGMKASLRGADFTKRSDLVGADFSGADLTGANLQGVDLTSATFADAILVHADLREATLEDVGLSNANCRHVQFSSARQIVSDTRGWDTATWDEKAWAALQRAQQDV